MRSEVEQLRERSQAPLNPSTIDETTDVRGGLSKALIEFKDLLALHVPERKKHLAWLMEGGIVMVFGSRGVGKTMLQLGLAASLTTGTNFMRWPVSAPVGVLYVDGEMSLDELRTRVTAFLPEPPKAPLIFLTSEWVYHMLEKDLVLTSEDTRSEITKIFDEHPDIRVLILDNISCLFSGIDEDRKKDWEPIAAWLCRLRFRGLAVILVHHAGKAGAQRGTSGREDSLDVVIQLDRPSGHDAREGCHFELRFTKSRSVKGDEVSALDVKLEEQNGQLQWTWRTLEDSKLDQVRRLFLEGVTSPTEIAEEIGITKGYASKLVRRIRTEGLG